MWQLISVNPKKLFHFAKDEFFKILSVKLFFVFEENKRCFFNKKFLL